METPRLRDLYSPADPNALTAAHPILRVTKVKTFPVI
jgi:hypothetical protein